MLPFRVLRLYWPGNRSLCFATTRYATGNRQIQKLQELILYHPQHLPRRCACWQTVAIIPFPQTNCTAYLISGTRLPEKPILLSFDDTDLDQYTVAFPEMKKYGFKGIFFIMTVSLGRPHYMSREQVRNLSDEGNTIGSHTWDHHNVKKYEGNDWIVQLDKPTRQLEQITGKSIRYFAYPFGLWNTAAFPELKKRGFVAAFQLNEKPDQKDPLYCIRRIIVPGTWNGSSLNQWIRRDF